MGSLAIMKFNPSLIRTQYHKPPFKTFDRKWQVFNLRHIFYVGLLYAVKAYLFQYSY